MRTGTLREVNGVESIRVGLCPLEGPPVGGQRLLRGRGENGPKSRIWESGFLLLCSELR